MVRYLDTAIAIVSNEFNRMNTPFNIKNKWFNIMNTFADRTWHNKHMVSHNEHFIWTV